MAPLAAGLLLCTLTACAHTGGTGSTEDSRDRFNRVTAEETERTTTRSVADMLEGRVAGVEVRQTSNGIAVRIRGAVSTSGNTAPLYVIDGLPVEAGPAGALAGLSPREIASIEVLKDAVDTTLYGARGANGVIVITTKRPGW